MAQEKLQFWNLGNTTLRNPNRILRGLSLFADEFQGRFHGDDEEIRFAQRLMEEGIVESSGKNAAWLGRKWRSAFVKLGFATDQGYRSGRERISPKNLAREKPALYLAGEKYELTPVGRRLIHINAVDSPTAIEDIFLRQLVGLELPSPIEPNFRDGQMKPFICLLQIVRELQRRNKPGPNKFEIAAFLQPFADHTLTLAEERVDSILEYRQDRMGLKKDLAKKFDRSVLKKLSEDSGNKIETPLDYADTTTRYSMLSGLFAWEGGQFTIRESKFALVDAILDQEPKFLAARYPLEYLENFYMGTSLPFDSNVFALDEIQSLLQQLREYGETPPAEALLVSPLTSVQDLDAIRYKLSDLLSLAHENAFAVRQGEPDAINDILEYLKRVEDSRKAKREGIIDPPAYLVCIRKPCLAIIETGH